MPLDECPSAETGLEAENNYIEYLDLSKYSHYLGQFLNILFTLPKNKLKCPKNVAPIAIEKNRNSESRFGDSTANLAHLSQKWAELAVQFSW